MNDLEMVLELKLEHINIQNAAKILTKGIIAGDIAHRAEIEAIETLTEAIDKYRHIKQ